MHVIITTEPTPQHTAASVPIGSLFSYPGNPARVYLRIADGQVSFGGTNHLYGLAHARAFYDYFGNKPVILRGRL